MRCERFKFDLLVEGQPFGQSSIFSQWSTFLVKGQRFGQTVNKTRFLVFGRRDLDFLVNGQQKSTTWTFWSKSTKVNIFGQSQQKSNFGQTQLFGY